MQNFIKKKSLLSRMRKNRKREYCFHCKNFRRDTKYRWIEPQKCINGPDCTMWPKSPRIQTTESSFSEFFQNGKP